MSLQSSETDSFVKVFARKVDKKTKSLKLSPKIQGKELKSIISNKLNIPFQDLSLYARGQEIQEEIQLSPKTIIHAIDLRNVKCDSISIHIKTLEKGASRHTFEVKTNLQIGEFIKESLQQVFHEKAEDLFLVYVGKQLNQKLSFSEQNVQNFAELVCVKCQQFRNNKKTIVNHNVTSEGKQKVYIQEENVIRDGQHLCSMNNQEELIRVEEEKMEESRDSGSKYTGVAPINKVTQIQSDRVDNVYELRGAPPIDNTEKAFLKTAEFGQIVKVEEKSSQQRNEEQKQNQPQNRPNQSNYEETPVQLESAPKQIVESAPEEVESTPNHIQASYEQLIEIEQKNVENKCEEAHQNEKEISDNKPFEEVRKQEEETKQEEEKVNNQIEEIPEDNPLQEQAIPEEKPYSVLGNKKEEIQQIPEDNPLKDEQEDINKDSAQQKQEQIQQDQEERTINEQEEEKGRDKEEAKKQEEQISDGKPLEEENISQQKLQDAEDCEKDIEEIPEDKPLEEEAFSEQKMQQKQEEKEQEQKSAEILESKHCESKLGSSSKHEQAEQDKIESENKPQLEKAQEIEQIPEDNPLQEQNAPKDLHQERKIEDVNLDDDEDKLDDSNESEQNKKEEKDIDKVEQNYEIPKDEPLEEEGPDNVFSEEEVPEQKYEEVQQIPEDKQMDQEGEEENAEIYAENKEQDIYAVPHNTPKETQENLSDPIENVQNIEEDVEENEEIPEERPEDIEQIPEDNPLEEEEPNKKVDSNEQQLLHVAQSAENIPLIESCADFQENNRKLEIIAQLPEQKAKNPVPPNGLSYEEIKVANSSKNSSSLVIYQEQVTIKTNNQEVSVVHSSEENIAIPVEQEFRLSKDQENTNQKKDEVNRQSYE